MGLHYKIQSTLKIFLFIAKKSKIKKKNKKFNNAKIFSELPFFPKKKQKIKQLSTIKRTSIFSKKT